MRSIELKQYIEDRKHLFWYSPAPKSETVSDELLVEVNKIKDKNKNYWEKAIIKFK